MVNAFRKVVWAGALVSVCLGGPSLGAEDRPTTRKVIIKVAPIYPPLAQTARLSGAVKLLAVVTPDGSVKSVRALGGSPMFVPAAEHAVKQWKFEVAKNETTEPVAVSFSNGQ